MWVSVSLLLAQRWLASQFGYDRRQHHRRANHRCANSSETETHIAQPLKKSRRRLLQPVDHLTHRCGF